MPSHGFTTVGAGYQQTAASAEDLEKMRAFQDNVHWFVLAERVRLFVILMILVVVVALCCCGCRACYRALCDKCGCCCAPCRLCWRVLCCQRAGAQPPPRLVRVGDTDVRVDHLRRRKELRAAYGLWLCGGLLGAHHFYLGRLVHGLLSAWSLNFLCLGWLLDLAFMPFYVGGSNRQVAAVAPRDGSCFRVCCGLPQAAVVVITVYFVAYTQIPDTLHRLRVVDVEKLAAATTTNPYDLLGVRRNATPAELDVAYSDRLQRLPKAGRCGSECEFLKAEYLKAFQFVKGDAWRRPDVSLAKLQRDLDDFQANVEPISITITTGESSKGRRVKSGESVTKSAKSRRQRKQPEEPPQATRDQWDDWSDYLSYEWKALARSAYSRVVQGRDGSSPSPGPKAEEDYRSARSEL